MAELRNAVGELKKNINTIEAAMETFSENRREMFEYFGQIEARFAAFPETSEPARFATGEKVHFPERRDSKDLAQWEVVRAEKGHYLLERAVPGDRAYHAICSDNELSEHNKR